MSFSDPETAVVERLQNITTISTSRFRNPEKPTDYFNSKVLTIQHHLALLRDQDEDFLNLMFHYPDIKAWAMLAQSEKADAFKTDWTNRSANTLPSLLLSVWVPQDVSESLGHGEKIESVLGIAL